MIKHATFLRYTHDLTISRNINCDQGFVNEGDLLMIIATCRSYDGQHIDDAVLIVNSSLQVGWTASYYMDVVV